MQRLGVAYHFDGEIKEVLGSISKSESAFKEDVISMSLLFRLLRENSFPVSQGTCLIKLKEKKSFRFTQSIKFKNVHKNKFMFKNT